MVWRERERERDLVYSIHLISKGVLSGINKVTISLMCFVMVLFISKKNRLFSKFCNSGPKEMWKNIQNENTKYICGILFPFVIFKREILTWMFIEQMSPF